MLLFISVVSTFCQAQARAREEEGFSSSKGGDRYTDRAFWNMALAGCTIMEA